MIEKPNFPDEKLIACLRTEYGLSIVQIAFLPFGGDLSSAVYRVVANQGTPYFCKLRRGLFDEISVALPKFLSEQGVDNIIPPLVTRSGQLWVPVDEFNLTLYPFVEGVHGYEVELSKTQWAEFGAALKRIHTIPLPTTLRQRLRKEEYSPEWREKCRTIMKRLEEETFDDPIVVDPVSFLQSKCDMIGSALGRAERLADVMASRAMEFVLCHSDIHPGNLFIDPKETLFIVDWDYPMLSPKERDLMFIGGGQGFMPYIAEQEEVLFYRGYGESNADPVALAYYRYERCITDIAVECERILSEKLGSQDRAQALEILQLYFLPDCTIEMAFKSDKT